MSSACDAKSYLCPTDNSEDRCARDGRHNGVDHKIFDSTVGESCCLALGISFRALAVGGFAVLRLADPC